MTDSELNGLEVAIIGLAGRFPGAKNVDEYWQNLREGKETISSFSNDELLLAGVSQQDVQDPSYVRRGGVIDDVELFDAAFFGYSPREAEILDPQQRLFLECAEEALENAGYDARTYRDLIGVYAGTGLNTYFLRNLYHRQNWSNIGDIFQLITASDKDFLASRVAYKLNLRGPALVVQTACSTSLVAIHMAVQALIGGECTIALAGGVTIRIPQKTGYRYQEGGILSPDGHCRAFDAQAQGTVASNGIGIVVLKRLEDALADRDHISAIIKGTAVNNDGAVKVGYTAPGIQGQTQVIRAAQRIAEVEADSIGYVEMHGTGTAAGDPIEIAAITEAFRMQTDKKAFCAIGSVKTNVGHMDAASGVGGVLKAVYSLQQGVLLPSLNFRDPNSAFHLEEGPFYVNTTLREWKTSHGVPRRAGVSSFGIGGTNAHIILEAAPELDTSARSLRPHQLIVLSARTEYALQQASLNLATHLRQHPELELADVASTLQVGRPLFCYRQALVGHSREDVAQALETNAASSLMRGCEEATERQVALLFPGQGAQYVAMGRDLYRSEPVFRAELDRCAQFLQPYLQRDLLAVFYPLHESEREEAAQQLQQTWLTQPALFALEYALAKQWEAWGVYPTAMIGHSIGEYVAACLAGVFSLEDALRLVAARGRLMQQLTEGAMLAVPLPEEEVQILLSGQLCLAAVNTNTQCVVSGPTAEIEALAQHLRARELDCSRLHTSHAFHSVLVEPIVDEFVALVRSIALHAPQIPYISNVTGTWITAEQAIDPFYWGRHMRQPVRFASGIMEILREPSTVLLEAGPGRTLSTFARQQSTFLSDRVTHTIIPSLRRPTEIQSDDEFMLTSLGRLWLAGVPIAWDKLHAGEKCRRVPLPTYPFERQRYWIDPFEQKPQNAHASVPKEEPQEIRREDMIVPSYPRPILPTSYVAPRNQTEQMLAIIWQELLGVSQVGIYDSFFELGGHSLLATQLVSRLRSQLQGDLPIQTIFEAATIAELGQLIEEHKQITLPEEVPSQPIHLVTREDPLPLSFAQQRLWFVDQVNRQSAAYLMCGTCQFQGKVDVRALESSLEALLLRHESLRTTFEVCVRTNEFVQAGQPVQIIHTAGPFQLPIIDLSALMLEERECVVQQLCTQEIQYPCDLSQGPLFRTRLLRLTLQEHLLLLTAHHIISDGWSMHILGRELTEYYQAFASGQQPSLSPLPIQYADFAFWQRQWLRGEVLDEQLTYWWKRLAGAPALKLPLDHVRPAVQSFRGGLYPFVLSPQLSQSLNTFSRQERCTLFMTLLAAFKVLLYRYTGQVDITLGTDSANRNRSETEGIIGFFINLLALRTDLSGKPTFREVLRRVRETMLGAYMHQETPFDVLVERMAPAHTLNSTPLVQALFVLQNVPPLQSQDSVQPHFSADATMPVITFRSLIDDVQTAKFDLAVFLQEQEGLLHGKVNYSADLFEASTIATLVTRFEVLLHSIVEQPDSPVDLLEFLTVSEKMQEKHKKRPQAGKIGLRRSATVFPLSEVKE